MSLVARGPPVHRLGHRVSVRLRVPVEHHQRRSIRVDPVEQTEQPVQLIALSAPHLVDTGHLCVHRFPLAANDDLIAHRRVPHGLGDGDDLSSGLGGVLEQPLLSVWVPVCRPSWTTMRSRSSGRVTGGVAASLIGAVMERGAGLGGDVLRGTDRCLDGVEHETDRPTTGDADAGQACEQGTDE